jgi:hypothetical protein
MALRREFPDEHEKPWTEEEWLHDMKRNDARADRFGELLETFQDAPDRDERVAREMGWDDMADALAERTGEEGAAPDEGSNRDDDDGEDDDGSFGFEGSEDDDDLDSEDHREPEPPSVKHPAPEGLIDSLPEPAEGERRQNEDDEESLFGRQPARKIAEYEYSHRVGIKLHWLLRPYASGDADEDPTDGLVGQALIGPHIASAKIVGGHSLGYGKHYINGNIACQRIGLDAVDKSMKAYDLLVKDGHVPAEFVKRIMPDLIRLREVLAARIERMRAYARSLHAE